MDIKAKVRRIMAAAYNIDGVYTYLSKISRSNATEQEIFYALNDGKLHSQKTISEEWCIPKTTLNTIIKNCEAEGLITLERSGKGRELYIRLTEMGKAHAEQLLQPIYEAEAAALNRTLEKYGDGFIEAMEYFVEEFEYSSDMKQRRKET